MQKTIFVAGIHGVGKTYLCESVTHLGLVIASASSIIKKELAETNWSKEKVVSDSKKNQEALVSGVAKIRKTESPKSLLLDGHFVLRTQNGFQSLDHSIFTSLDVDAVLLVEEEPEKIAFRLKSRDLIEAPKDLREFLQLERAQAEKFTSDKSKPLFIIRSGDKGGFLEAVKKIIHTEES